MVSTDCVVWMSSEETASSIWMCFTPHWLNVECAEINTDRAFVCPELIRLLDLWWRHLVVSEQHSGKVSVQSWSSISIASSWPGDLNRWVGCQYPAAYPPLRGSDSALRPALYRTTAWTTAPVDANTSVTWFFWARPSKMACGLSGLCLAKTTCEFRTTKENIKKIYGIYFSPTLKEIAVTKITFWGRMWPMISGYTQKHTYRNIQSYCKTDVHCTVSGSLF